MSSRSARVGKQEIEQARQHRRTVSLAFARLDGNLPTVTLVEVLTRLSL